jgi:hypothetical protein
MDRNIVYPGSIPLDTDMLSLNRNVMFALAALTQATLGPGPFLDGLVCTPAQSGLAVEISPGVVASMQSVDGAPYGSLPADTADSIVKMGINIASTSLTLPAPPTTAGQSVAYLIQISFAELDTNPVVLPYYNAANPSQPFSGPNNSLGQQNTLRRQVVQIAAKAGPVSGGGTPSLPPADAGWLGIYTVVVNAGDLSVNPANITPIPTAPALPYKLGQLRPGFGSATAVFTWSGTFTVPDWVSQLEVEVWGGGAGSAASSATNATEGGAGGGYARRRVAGLTPGQQIAVSVGDGGQAGTVSGQSPLPGGTSSFGPYAAATGGDPGGYASGNGVGGDVNVQGGSATPVFGSQIFGGQGGNGAMGGGMVSTTGTNGGNGWFPGGGASGAAAGRYNGGQGANGMIVVRW